MILSCCVCKREGDDYVWTVCRREGDDYVLMRMQKRGRWLCLDVYAEEREMIMC